MIGAWGFKFFEGDHDHDIAAHLSADMGLSKYNRNPKMQDSLLHPKDRDFVIQHIQNPDELDRVFKKYFDMLQDYKVIDIKATLKEETMIDSPRYYIFLLGLLAMQLGCTLSRKHRRWMKANWDSCLFMYERIDQAKMAAFEYQNGTPLKLGSMTLHEKECSLAPNERLNVPNNAKHAFVMRMHLDNEVAKGKGASITNGVDINNAFSHDAAYVAALEHIATEKAKHSAGMDSVPETPSAPADRESKATQWASNQAGWDRLKQHKAEGPAPPVKKASTEEMAKILADLKNGSIGRT
ncbi:hypothetical protein PMIN07_007805 [Paraphaeosphaeria minitans]